MGARIRTVKPDFWESEKLGQRSLLARFTFMGLISLADDHGRGRAGAMFLFGRLHPYSRDVRPEDLGKALKELESVRGGKSGRPLVVFYEVDGCHYYLLPGWHDHQRIDSPQLSQIPVPADLEWACENYNACQHKQIPGSIQDRSRIDPSRKGREGNGNGMEGRRRSRGDRTKDGGSARGAAAVAGGFDRFWAAYPRRVARVKAEAVWDRLRPGPALESRILAAVARQSKCDQWVKDGGQFIPHPTTWLNQRRWEDEPPMVPAGSSSGGRVVGHARPSVGKFDDLDQAQAASPAEADPDGE